MYQLTPLIIGAVCAYLAHHKGRSKLFWFFVGMFTNIVGVIIIALLPNVRRSNWKFGEEDYYYEDDEHNGFENYYENKVYCPFCNNNCKVEEEGNWTCPYCSNIFVYKNNRAYKFEEKNTQLLTNIIKLFSKIAKADGKVTVKEIQIVDRSLKEQFRLNEVQIAQAKDIFDKARLNISGYSVIIKEINNQLDYSITSMNIKDSIVKIMIQIIKVDGYPHQQQMDILRDTVNLFGLSWTNYAKYFMVNKEVHRDVITKYYDILECSKNADEKEIKRAYRRMMQKYHPDKYEGEGVSEATKKYAHEKCIKIQEAYEKVMKNKVRAV